MDKHHMPQYLDEPTRVILWTIDELIFFLVPVLILFFGFDQLILGIVTGIAFIFGLRKLKGEQGHYFLHSLMYWHLPAIVRFKSTPPSYYREFLG